MKRSFFLLCAVLFVLGSLLPLAGYRLAKTVLGPSAPASSAAAPEPETPDAASLPPSDRDSETFLIADQSDGAVVSVPRRPSRPTATPSTAGTTHRTPPQAGSPPTRPGGRAI